MMESVERTSTTEGEALTDVRATCSEPFKYYASGSISDPNLSKAI